MKKIALISLGCAKNLVDSEVMLGLLPKEAYMITTEFDSADVIIVNTCGFIQPARQESWDALKNAVAAKRRGRAKKVIAAGCYVQRYQPELAEGFPEIDGWVGVNDFDKITSVIEGLSYERSKNCFLYDHTTPRILSTPSSWGYLKISEGCSHRCSFCAIPQIKGRYRSRSISSIVQEAEKLASQGLREINLVSQDSTYFGRDVGLKNGLVMLLQELVQVNHLEWIRVLYGYPDEISDPILEIMREDKICSYLDIPFQHSDPAILKNMKRGMDGRKAMRLIQKIRTRIPDVSLRTSLIVGFPGEGEKEFQNLTDFVRSAEFDHLGVFTYSPEKGTNFFYAGDPVKENIKQIRREKILELQAGISRKNTSKYVGRMEPVLLEGHWKDDPTLFLGRTRYQAPEVDGVVFVEDGKKHSRYVGSVRCVEITAGDVYDLYGKLII